MATAAVLQNSVVNWSLADVAPPPEVQAPPDWRDMKVDFEEMTARYNEERLKRIKKAGIEQYQHVIGSKSGVLPDMIDDPFVEPGFKRDPVTEEHDLVIAGGGVGGIIMACRLVKAGFQKIKIIEKAGNFGGVW